MQFIERCKKILEEYDRDQIVRKNGTILLGSSEVLRGRHVIYKGLSREYINEHLIDNYKGKIPEVYLSFLEIYNGILLFRVKLNIKDTELSFIHEQLQIFGLPLTAPYMRKDDEEEPADIRIEDLARHKKIPKSWLKFGCYIRDLDFEGDDCDLFIDTVDGHIYSCRRRKNKILEEWKDMDTCLCDIIDRVSGNGLEYIY